MLCRYAFKILQKISFKMTYVDKLIKITVVNKNEIEKLENIKMNY